MPTSPDPMDLLFSSLSLSSASFLTQLDLCYCNLKAISNDIGSLFSLEILNLSGNDFVCLPESIIRLSNLTWMGLNNCTSLRSLPKFPLNIVEVEVEGCISLETLPDPFKPSNSLEASLYLLNCFQLADNQSCMDRFISGIKRSLKLSPSLPPSYYNGYNFLGSYNIVIPGSEIPEWFSYQSMWKEVKIKQPSHLYEKVGIAFCFMFCTLLDKTSYDLCSLMANGKRMYIGHHSITDTVLSSDHLCVVYVTPQFFYKGPNKLLWEGDTNGFSQIRIKIEANDLSLKVKKWGFRMIYKKDIEDLDRKMFQSGNSSITPYDGMDVLHHNLDNSSVVVECHKVKRSHDDYNEARPSKEGSSNDIPNPKGIKRHTETHGNFDSKDCDEELCDWDNSNDDSEEDNDDSEGDN